MEEKEVVGSQGVHADDEGRVVVNAFLKCAMYSITSAPLDAIKEKPLVPHRSRFARSHSQFQRVTFAEFFAGAKFQTINLAPFLRGCGVFDPIRRCSRWLPPLVLGWVVVVDGEVAWMLRLQRSTGGQMTRLPWSIRAACSLSSAITRSNAPSSSHTQ